jgi:hypothetical protein
MAVSTNTQGPFHSRSRQRYSGPRPGPLRGFIIRSRLLRIVRIIGSVAVTVAVAAASGAVALYLTGPNGSLSCAIPTPPAEPDRIARWLIVAGVPALVTGFVGAFFALGGGRVLWQLVGLCLAVALAAGGIVFRASSGELRGTGKTDPAAASAHRQGGRRHSPGRLRRSSRPSLWRAPLRRRPAARSAASRDTDATPPHPTPAPTERRPPRLVFTVHRTC